MASPELPRSRPTGQQAGYVDRRFPGGSYFPCVDYKLDKERVLKRVSDVSDNERAAKYVANNSQRSKGFSCCYVIGSEGATSAKIGHSRNPLARIKSLSAAFPERPRIYGLFWSFENPAAQIETYALRAAKLIGIRGHGEWVRLDGMRATEFVLQSLWGKAVFVDSRAFWEQWVTRSVLDMPERYWTDNQNNTLTGTCGYGSTDR